MKRTIPIALACLTVLFVSTRQAQADLVLTINTYTTDELSFTISGTFAANSIGDSAGWLAIKNDWSNNIGVHTEMFSALPSITANTIKIGGLTPGSAAVNAGDSFYDAIQFENPNGGVGNAFTAGTQVTGSMTLFSVGAFDPADIATLELVSGFSPSNWVRLEASAVAAVPEPTTGSALILAVLGGLCLTHRRRRKCIL